MRAELICRVMLHVCVIGHDVQIEFGRRSLAKLNPIDRIVGVLAGEGIDDCAGTPCCSIGQSEVVPLGLPTF